MRILTESLLLDPAGGLEMSTLQISLELAKRGHTLQVMYGTDGLLRSQYETAGITLDGPTQFEFDVHKPLRGMVKFIKPARAARAWGPDVIWLNRFEKIHWAQAVATWSRSPIVCHLRHMPHPVGTSILRHNVSHFVAISEFMREAWVEAGINPKRISVIHNSLPPDEYPRGGIAEQTVARKELGLPLGIPIVLFYGRMIEEKGIGTLLDAWTRLRMGPDQALLVLVGPPSPSTDVNFERLLRSVATDSYRWFDMQRNVTPYLHAADLVVFPTLLEEGFGRVVIEGLKTGRPVLASRIGAVPEILSGPTERFLFEPRNAAELAVKIHSLLEWRHDEPELETTCSNWVERRFPFEANVTAFEDVLLQFCRKDRRTKGSR